MFDLEQPRMDPRPPSRAEFLQIQDTVARLQAQLDESRMQGLINHNNQPVPSSSDPQYPQPAVENLAQGFNGMNIRRELPPHQAFLNQPPASFIPAQPIRSFPQNIYSQQPHHLPQLNPNPNYYVNPNVPPIVPQYQPRPTTPARPFVSSNNEPYHQSSQTPLPRVPVVNQMPSHHPMNQFVPPPPTIRTPMRPLGSISGGSNAVARFRNDIRFDGTSSKLKSFFQDFYGEIRTNEAYFSERDDKFKINWLATLFVPGSSVKNWFMSLLEQNAEGQGRFDGYDDLQGLVYDLEALSSFPKFLRQLRFDFADKNEDRTNRRNLDNCIQGNNSIVDYNSRFRSLVLHVSISPEDAIIKYVNGLDRDVHHEAIRLNGWVNCRMLQEKMNLAVQASEIVRELSELPHNHPGYLKKKFKSDHFDSRSIPIPITYPVRKSDQAVPMDIDAVAVKKAGSMWLAIVDAARERGLCAKCFEKYDLQGSHAKGVCPNRNKTINEKLKFFKIKPVSQVTIEQPVEEFNVNSIAFVNTSSEQSLAVQEFMDDFFSSMNEIVYPELIQEEQRCDISSIRVDASPAANGFHHATQDPSG